MKPWYGSSNKDSGSDQQAQGRLTEKDLGDGELLRTAILKFHGDRSKENLFGVFELLRDSTVYIPCQAVFSDVDREALDQMVSSAKDAPAELIGREFTAKGDVRLIPDILQNGDDLYFPVFSSEDVMGDEYRSRFSVLPVPFLQALAMAEASHYPLAGIVVDAFTEPLDLNFTLAGIIKKIPSQLC